MAGMATRICVKNLPKECDERQLRRQFEKFGPFTDVKLMRTGDGVSRGFGFIGFEETAKAMEAVQYFNQSFIGMRRISVELARKVGDRCLSRPWSKYSKGSSGYQALHPQETQDSRPKEPEKAQSVTQTQEEDKELREFLDLMMPCKGVQKWEDAGAPPQSKRKRQEGASSQGGAEGERVCDPAWSHGPRLFVRNLPFTATEADLTEVFGRYGDLTEVHIVLEKEGQKSKGFGFVEFEDSSSAASALAEMDGSIFRGRLLHILPSQSKRQKMKQPKTERPEMEADSSFKREKAEQLKEQAGNRSAWNTFYMRPDTITEAVADFYGVSKSELMHRDASDLGVRLALGETHVLAKTKEDLENAGVDVSKLEEAAGASGKASSLSSIPRCKDTLIVKNLPYNATEGELREMFESFGEIVRFVMPFTRVLAILQFQDASDAKRAFRSLAYKKFKSVPIYLEWAPQKTLQAPLEQAPDQEEAEEVQEELGVSLYVKNLSFSTKDADLAKHFDTAASEIGGHLRSARVARRTHANGTIVSAGFGFVEVNSDEVAKHILHKLQSSLLDGHVLQLRRSTKAAAEIPSHPSPEDSLTSKLIVKNLAFECTRQDVLSLFGPYGHVQSCRLPKKFDGSHRGFAFVQFVTKEEAKGAKEKIQGTHLYGRRLNIDFAKEEV